MATNGTPADPWDSWSKAFTTLEDAVSEADPGDTIYVAGHVFLMSAQIGVSGKDNLTIIGGFEAANDTQQPGTPDPSQWPTVLQRIGSPNFHSSPRFRFLDISSVSGFVLDGVTMTGGFPAIGEHGGALRMANSSGVEIRNCVFDSNLVYIYNGTSRGGAIHASNTSGIITNTVFTGNGSFNGYAASSQHAEAGALYVSGGAWEIRDSQFRGNRTHKVVGTSYGSVGTGLFETYINRGGAALISGGTHVIHNVAFAGNAAVGSGSAIRVENAATVLSVVNATLSGNTGGEALHVAAGTVAVTNSIFWYNERDIAGGGTITLAYSNTEDGFDAGNNGNISADPRFERGLYLGAESASTHAGTGTASDWGLSGRTTHAGGTPPSGTVDQGYHFASGIASATADLYVAPGGDNGNAGTGWGSALASVTHALSLAHDGTRIHIAAGSYTNSATAEQFPLVIDRKWGIQLLGDGADETTLAVVGGTRVRLLNLAHPAGDTLVSGIRFTDGYPANNNDGGAVRGDYGHVEFAGCLFQGNRAQNTINQNRPLGGALYAHEARVNLSDTHFTGNRAFNSYGATDSGRSRGGAAYFFRGRSRIDRSRLIGNISNKSTHENFGSEGGALFYFRGQHAVYSALVVSNMASGAGAAMASDNAILSLNNLTVADNTNTVALLGTGGGVSVTNSIFRNHPGGDFSGIAADAFFYSSATGLVDNVQGNMTADPLFIGNGDYRLQPIISPAIDTGTNQAWMIGAKDVAGTNRILRALKSDTVDRGASETLPPADTGLEVLALPPANVTGDEALARMILIGSGGQPNTDVYLCWGSADAGNTATSLWPHVVALGDAWEPPIEISWLLTDLTPGANYAYRFYATNDTATIWTDLIAFSTIGFQEVQNDGMAWVRYRQANVEGTVIDDGGEPVTVWVEYWPSSGSVTSTVPIGSVAESESFGALISSLTPDTEYSFRFAASNVLTTAYSGVDSFTTLEGNPFAWYVSGQGAATSGMDWDNALSSLAAVWTWIEPGDTIYLAGETFTLDAGLELSVSDVSIIGGHAATNNAVLPGERDSSQWPTVLQRIGSPNFHSTPRFRFFDVSSVSGFVLDGITMLGGFPAEGGHGAALLVQNSSGVEIRNCVFDSNLIYRYYGAIRGGAIYAHNTSGIITNTVFTGNGSFNGYAASSDYAEAGALYVSGGAWEIRDSQFRGNLTHKVVGTSYGGSTGASLVETYDNRGGAVLFSGGSHRVRNVAFAGNAAVGSGSAIRVENAATVLSVVNATLSGNTGGEALHVAAGTVAVTNSIFWHNDGDIAGGGTITLAYSNTEDGFDAGNNGNISTEPRFERGLYLEAESASTHAGTGTASDWGLSGRTTRADGTPPSGTVDQGYHFASGISPAVADLYVAPGGDNGNAGTGWGSALASVTHALTLARDGTRIHIAAGSYTNSATAEQFPLVIDRKWGIQLLGDGADETTLAVVGGTRVRLLDLAHPAGDTRIDGIRFTDGYPANNNDGGAVRVDYGHVEFAGCLFQGNQAQNTINQNRPLGGALYAHEARINLSDTHFEGNRAFNSYGSTDSGRSRGGAAYFFRGRSRIDRSRLIGNISHKSNQENFDSRGGALFYFRGQHALYSALVVSNMASGAGAAMASDNAILSLNNLTVADNTNTVALLVTGGGVSATNSIFRNHPGGDFSGIAADAFFYSSATGLVDNVQGNMTADPLFIGNGDYRLQPGSPAINAGTNQEWMNGAFDLAGEKRRVGGTVDLGAYERPGATGSIFLFR